MTSANHHSIRFHTQNVSQDLTTMQNWNTRIYRCNNLNIIIRNSSRNHNYCGIPYIFRRMPEAKPKPPLTLADLPSACRQLVSTP